MGFTWRKITQELPSSDEESWRNLPEKSNSSHQKRNAYSSEFRTSRNLRPPPKNPLSFRYDKLIIDDQVYIYNDSEKRIERLPFSVYSMAATGSISPEHTRGGGGSQINGKINGHQAIRGAAGAVSNAGLMAAGIPRRLTFLFFSKIGLCVQVCRSQISPICKGNAC